MLVTSATLRVATFTLGALKAVFSLLPHCPRPPPDS